MSTGLEVIAVGARTPIGLVAQTAAAAARAGICRIREYPFVTVSGEPMMMASDAKLPATLEGAERLVPLARCVLEEVAHELAAAPRPYRGHVDPWLSLPEARPGMPERDIMRTAETLAAALRASGTPLRCDVAGRGHAGVALAVERTAQTNVRGEEHLTVILGVDSYLHPETFVWLEGNRSFGPDTRSGFAPGEGAGCLVLASTRLRKSLGLPCLAVVGGVATAQEHRLPGSETGSLGEGMTAAVFGAISGLRLPTEAVDTVYCDINGERYRSEEWGFVALRASATFRAPEYEAPADCWGDMGAASGALFGPSGSPPNSATLMGVIQMSGMVTVIEDEKCPICGEDHRFEESEATKLDAGALAGNFKGQVAAAAAAGAAKDPPVKVSANTMLGVVHCKCGKKYADQSAMTTVELCRAAAAAGMKHLPGVTVSYADGRGALDAAYLETLDRVKKGIGGHLGNSELFQDTWEKAEDRAKDSDENRSGPAAVVVHDHDPPVAGVCSRPWPTLGAGCSRSRLTPPGSCSRSRPTPRGVVHDHGPPPGRVFRDQGPPRDHLWPSPASDEEVREMAYREVQMWEILNVLRRIGRGESKAAVAVATEHTRRTVRRYVQVAEALGWVPGEHEPDEALALEVYRAVRPGVSSDEAGSVEAKLLPHREAITKWLEGEGANDPALRLTKIHRKLEGNGVSVSYPSLRRFVIKHCGFTGRARKLTVRLDEVPPGEVAQVDFGRLGLIEVEPGKRRAVHALVVTLVHSRHQYVHITFEQKLPQLIDGLEDAWEFFGGVTARVIIDNLKAAVTKADRYDPIFQRTFEEYADYRGFVIDAAGVGSPTHKPHVERGVPYVRDSFFKGERWLGIEHLRREVIRWICEVAGQRKHGTTQRKPLEVFEQSERSKLLPLLRPRFDPPTWSTDLKVHTDHCINFDKALYTVPTRHVGKHVDARGDSKLVRIYLKGELIKTHPRKPQGGRSLDHNDYPKEKAGYTMRDPDRMIRQAREHGEHVGSFMERLLEGDYPWAKLRQAHALLRLVSKYGHQRVDAACQRALGFDLVNVKRVERIIKAAPASSNTADDAAPRGQLIQLPLRFQRLAGSFNHQQQSRGQEHEDHRDPTVAQGGDETPTPVGAAADAARQDRLRPQGEAE